MAETFLNLGPIAIALAGGVLPALVWLWFWNEQDHKAHEPKGLIALSFVAGMAVVYFVLPVQNLIAATLPAIMDILGAIALKWSLIIPNAETVQIILWSGVEEFAKYATVFLIAFQSKHFDEPIDAVIYLITAALGFSAMENTLYLLKDLADMGVLEVILNSNMRFIGATILHVASSALIGIAIAFSFYGLRFGRFLAIAVGLILATLLHAHFNLSIIESDGTMSILAVFSSYWAVIIGIIILLGIIKRMKPNKTHI